MKNNFYPYLDKEIPMAEKAEGIYITDVKGVKYLDGSSGAMTAGIGHCNKEITETIKRQLDILTYVCRFQFNSQPLEDLCEKIASMAPRDLNRVYIVNSGSEATEAALKLAMTYWKSKGKSSKRIIISRKQSYHGSTLGALSMTGHSARRKKYAEYLHSFPQIETAFCYHCPFEKEYPSCGLFCARQLERVIEGHGADNVSALIAEPIVGASAAGVTPPDGYYQTIKTICEKNNVLLIMDEIVTGFGRTGKTFASEHWGLVPDIITFGKGISGGYATVAGMVVRDEIFDSIALSGEEFSTGHTLGGNPLAAVSACSVLEYIEKYDLVNQACIKGELLYHKLLELKEKHKIIADVRGKGLLIGIEIMRNPDNKILFSRKEKMTERLVEACFGNQLIVYASSNIIDGRLGDSILISPPLIINEQEMDELIKKIDKSLGEIEDMYL